MAKTSKTSTPHNDHHERSVTGWRRWLLTTKYKDIGTMYLWFAGFATLLGGVLSMLVATARPSWRYGFWG